jgi:peptidoglycan/LPS O-acetylase OafA/YrhL
MAEPRRIPILDGLRAISIALVVIEHLQGTKGFPVSRELATRLHLGDCGRLGVTVFFVISGYLITTLLLREHERTGTLHLGRFYLRRTFRIFPAFYVLIAVVGLLWSAGYVRLLPGDLFHASTYTMNYHWPRAWALGHTWSLAVEEQFYLLWPAMLLFLGLRRGLAAAATFVVLAPFLRYVTWMADRGGGLDFWEPFHTTFDSIAVGCLLAGWRRRLDGWAWYRATLASRWFFVVPLLVLASPIALHDRPRFTALFGATAVNLGIGLTLDWLLHHPDGRIGRLLDWKPLALVGTWSYSIYLWQELFLDHKGDALATPFPWNLLAVFAVAAASYYLVERPCLALRERLERRIWPTRG